MAKTSKPVIKIAFDAIEVLLFLNERLVSTVSASRVGHCGSSEIELKSALQYGHFKASSPMLLAQWGQSLVRIPPLVTNDCRPLDKNSPCRRIRWSIAGTAS